MAQNDQKIPIVIGVTGHRDLPEGEKPRLKNLVKKELQAIKAACPHSPLVLLSSLAEGADQLCAEAALEEGYELAVPLPMPLDDYKTVFRGDPLESFCRLLDAAGRAFVVPETEPHKPGRDHLYRQAGIYIAEHSHILIALWDGKAGKKDGCGTAETVSFMRGGAFSEPEYTGLKPAPDHVIWIKTHRSGAETIGGLSDTFSGGSEVPRRTPDTTQVVRTGEASFRQILEETDDFTAEIDGLDLSGAAAPGDTSGKSKAASLYEAADTLSMKNAGVYRAILAFMSVAATLVTMAFLLYDEMEQHWMIIICGLMIAGLFAITHFEKKSRSHRKYIEYRVLAEGLRVQAFLKRAGISAGVADLIPWPVHTGTPWIAEAFSALDIPDRPLKKHSVRKMWIDDQLAYHKKALAKTEAKARANDRLMKAALALTILSYAAALIFELRYGGLLFGHVRLPHEQLESVRTILKIVLGSLSAATLFAGNYYGKLSLGETIDDHRRMIALYETALQKVEQEGETETFLIKLAREELNEVSRWYSYQKMNTPDIGL